MSYVTMPDPCHPWHTPKGKFNNLGGFGSYAALRKIYPRDIHSRYIYETRGPTCRSSIMGHTAQYQLPHNNCNDSYSYLRGDLSNPEVGMCTYSQTTPQVQPVKNGTIMLVPSTSRCGNVSFVNI